MSKSPLLTFLVRKMTRTKFCERSVNDISIIIMKQIDHKMVHIKYKFREGQQKRKIRLIIMQNTIYKDM